MKKVFEMVSFKIVDNKKVEEFLKASEELNTKVFPKLKGFIGRKLLRGEDQNFCDLLLWETMKDAKNAMDVVMQCETCLKMFQFIDQSSMMMNHFEVLSATKEDLNFEAGALEIGLVELNKNSKIEDVLEKAEQVHKKYLSQQNGFVAQFLAQNENGLYSEIVFNQKDMHQAKEICSGYLENPICLDYISHFNQESTKLDFFEIV
ncbi:hypothetical protein MJH12_12630 [bacterium]|nr:hypothetical protein [bacterium]